MIVYLDSSAAMKVFLNEPESLEFRTYLERLSSEGVLFASSRLLETELFRGAAVRQIDPEKIAELLSAMNLHNPDEWTFRHAGQMPGDNLRSLDAIHVATALQLQVDVLVTYDDRMSAAALNAGLVVYSPGVE